MTEYDMDRARTEEANAALDAERARERAWAYAERGVAAQEIRSAAERMLAAHEAHRDTPGDPRNGWGPFRAAREAYFAAVERAVTSRSGVARGHWFMWHERVAQARAWADRIGTAIAGSLV